MTVDIDHCRDASAPELCQQPRKIRIPSQKTEGSGAPKGHPTIVRASQTSLRSLRKPICARKRAKIGARSPSGAPLRHSPAQSQPPLAQLQNHVSWNEAGAGVLPASGLSSPASSSQTGPFAGQCQRFVHRLHLGSIDGSAVASRFNHRHSALPSTTALSRREIEHPEFESLPLRQFEQQPFDP